MSITDNLGLLAEKHPADKSTNGVVGKIGRKMPTAPSNKEINPISIPISPALNNDLKV